MRVRSGGQLVEEKVARTCMSEGDVGWGVRRPYATQSSVGRRRLGQADGLVSHRRGPLPRCHPAIRPAGYCHGGLETIGIASSPSWRGPWALANTAPVLTDAGGKPHSCEDPTLWQSDRGWHLMVHDQSGGFVARYAHSATGVDGWVLHDAPTTTGPYNGTVTYADGSVAHTDVERPELVFDPVTRRPTHLVNGAFAGAAGNLSSFTLVRPLHVRA